MSAPEICATCGCLVCESCWNCPTDGHGPDCSRPQRKPCRGGCTFWDCGRPRGHAGPCQPPDVPTSTPKATNR